MPFFPQHPGHQERDKMAMPSCRCAPRADAREEEVSPNLKSARKLKESIPIADLPLLCKFCGPENIWMYGMGHHVATHHANMSSLLTNDGDAQAFVKEYAVQQDEEDAVLTFLRS